VPLCLGERCDVRKKILPNAYGFTPPLIYEDVDGGLLCIWTCPALAPERLSVFWSLWVRTPLSDEYELRIANIVTLRYGSENPNSDHLEKQELPSYGM
jgi:hypothetical protein